MTGIDRFPPPIGAKQPLDADLTALGGLGDGYPTRTGGAWSAQTAKDHTAGLSALTINVKHYGAVGDGVTDDSAAFLAAVTAAKAAARTIPFSLQSDQVGSVAIDIPPGTYIITQAGAMLGAENTTTKRLGLRWRGAGMGVTSIVFNPATPGALLSNDYWLWLAFEDMSFYANPVDCTFMDSNTTHSAQRYSFRNVYWKKFKYVFDLKGSNNNSDFGFYFCHTAAIQADGAFLFVADTGTSDQFLTYCFYDFTHWSTSAPVIDAARGGNFQFYGIDVSDYGTALTAQSPTEGYIFRLRGNSHAWGVCNFVCHGLRVEGKSPYAGIIYSEWPQGNVSFVGTDFSSQNLNQTYNDIIDLKMFDVGGPAYTFRDSILAGGVKVRYGTGNWQKMQQIRFEDCQWLQRASPSDVVTYVGSTSNTAAKPPVDFRNCRGPNTNVLDTTNGAAVWDARVGLNGQLMQSLTHRILSLRGIGGPPTGSTVLTFTLPVGALITGMELVMPAGTVTESDGGSWALTTTEATPATVATLTVSGAMSAGAYQKLDLTVPYYCSTTDKAKLKITPTGVGQLNSPALLSVKGYW